MLRKNQLNKYDYVYQNMSKQSKEHNRRTKS